VKQLFFLSGIPRSGITLISAILNQNPNIYVTTTSPLVELLWRNYKLWEENREDFATKKLQDIKKPYLRKLTNLYYSELTNKPVVIDKRRQWQNIENIKMYKNIFGEMPKIICPVRNVEEIIASFISLYQKNNRKWNYKEMKDNIFENSYFQLKECFNSEFRGCLLLVEYNDLVTKTKEVLDKIYDFVKQPSYKHDLNNIVSNESEEVSDLMYRLMGLHTISKTIIKSQTDPRKILTKEQYIEYKKWNFWK
jgi:sulfotransferase